MGFALDHAEEAKEVRLDVSMLQLTSCVRRVSLACVL